MKSLVIVELISEFPSDESIVVEDEPFPDEHIFLISTFDPWYRDIFSISSYFEESRNLLTGTTTQVKIEV